MLSVCHVDALSSPYTRKRKRLKVPNACHECRRKKTKCNGEKPCTRCIKLNIDCRYVPSPKQKFGSQTSQKKTADKTGNNSASCITVESIEERLTVIEDILRALVKDGNQAHRSPVFGTCAPSGGSYYTHRGQNWQQARGEQVIAPTPRRPQEEDYYNHYHHHHHHQQQPQQEDEEQQQQQQQQQQHRYLPPLRASVSASSTGSTSSLASITCPSIKNLLNDDNVDIILPGVATLPTPPPTATYFSKEPPKSAFTLPYEADQHVQAAASAIVSMMSM
ncbi:hypothetical protein VTP01DRAFT_3051 [Rhizomucor pusillus]|uniref:uncharacterized protein n=1 Tax=Rhizomucor pusillus TaxID=4840 RepID=UPI0037448366